MAAESPVGAKAHLNCVETCDCGMLGEEGGLAPASAGAAARTDAVAVGLSAMVDDLVGASGGGSSGGKGGGGAT